jgi:hypothetical protein
MYLRALWRRSPILALRERGENPVVPVPVPVRPTVEDGVFGIYFGVHQVAQADLRVQNQSH